MSVLRLPSLLLVLLVALAGCLSGNAPNDANDEPAPVADFSDLTGDGAKIADDVNRRTFTWEGAVGPGAAAPLVGGLPGAEIQRHAFDVKSAVGAVEVRLETDGSGIPLFVAVRDSEDRIACAWVVTDEPDGCTAAVEPGLAAITSYHVEVRQNRGSGDTTAATTAAYTVAATLIPRFEIPRIDLDPIVSTAMTFNLFDTGYDGGEPTLGVDKDGALFVVEGTATLRSTDDGATWQDVTPPLTTVTLDPMLFVDPWTGRVFSNHLYVACSYLSWSDDKGETWVTNPAACGNTAIDHQKLAVGGAAVPNPAFDGTVYFSYNSFALLAPGAAHLIVSRSLDGGITWTTSIAATEALDFPYRTGGPIAADRDGNVYIPMYLTDGGFGVAASNDHGVTWNAVRVGDQSAGGEGIDPGLAIDTAGNAYGAYWGEGAMRVVHSTDQGATWSDVAVVSPPELKSFVLADATAGDAGRVAVAYLATAESDKGPNRAEGYARWHLFVSFSENALDANATWTTVRATPAEDPIQIGPICTGGVGCFGGNRNLLDFIDIQPGPDGRLYIAYTDGCTDADCVVAQTSRDDRGFVAVQADGPRLFVERAPWA